jgi:hypothetical protein
VLKAQPDPWFPGGNASSACAGAPLLLSLCTNAEPRSLLLSTSCSRLHISPPCWPDSPRREKALKLFHYCVLMSNSDAAAKAAAQAFHNFAIESFTLYAIGVSVTLLRTYARVRAVGFRNLKPADYLVWVGVVRVPMDSTARFILLILMDSAVLHCSVGSCVHRWKCCSRTRKQWHDRCPASRAVP